MHYSKTMKPYVLDETEHSILLACACLNGRSTTNTAIGRTARAGLLAADVGLILSRLRAVKLITYVHIETGRMAAGSGRFIMRVFNDYFGEVLHGEAQDLP